jgi:membrane protease YdiL (CAAX protease family)
MPLFFIFVISHLRNKHKLKIDNFYPIKLGDDNQNLFHLSVILIPFIILFMMYSGSLQMMSQSELIFSSIFLAPIVEEFIFRHYLINRLTDIYGNSHKGVFLSIIISSLIFAMGHSYQGIFGVIIAGLKGVVFAGLYLLYRKNLVVPTLTHSLNNLLTFL